MSELSSGLRPAGVYPNLIRHHLLNRLLRPIATDNVIDSSEYDADYDIPGDQGIRGGFLEITASGSGQSAPPPHLSRILTFEPFQGPSESSEVIGRDEGTDTVKGLGLDPDEPMDEPMNV